MLCELFQYSRPPSVPAAFFHPFSQAIISKLCGWQRICPPIEPLSEIEELTEIEGAKAEVPWHVTALDRSWPQKRLRSDECEELDTISGAFWRPVENRTAQRSSKLHLKIGRTGQLIEKLRLEVIRVLNCAWRCWRFVFQVDHAFFASREALNCSSRLPRIRALHTRSTAQIRTWSWRARYFTARLSLLYNLSANSNETSVYCPPSTFPRPPSSMW